MPTSLDLLTFGQSDFKDGEFLVEKFRTRFKRGSNRGSVRSYQFGSHQTSGAIHGAYWHDRFGAVKSHGCINVAPLDARFIFEWLDPKVPLGWTSLRPADLRESPTLHVWDSHRKPTFKQERPIGPPNRDDEAERLEDAEKRRAETQQLESARP